MSNPFPTQAQIVIIGGGVIGTSLAYHLSQLGGTDVLLQERRVAATQQIFTAAVLTCEIRDLLFIRRIVYNKRFARFN